MYGNPGAVNWSLYLMGKKTLGKTLGKLQTPRSFFRPLVLRQRTTLRINPQSYPPPHNRLHAISARPVPGMLPSKRCSGGNLPTQGLLLTVLVALLLPWMPGPLPMMAVLLAMLVVALGVVRVLAAVVVVVVDSLMRS